MSLDAVSKVEILCHGSSRESVLAAMESFGRVHLVDLTEMERPGDENWKLFLPASMDTSEMVEKISSLENAMEFLKEEAGDACPPEGRSGSVREKDLLEELSDDTLIEKARRAWFTAIRMAKLEGAEKELVQEREFLEAWKGLPVPIEELRSQGAVLLSAGTIEKDAVEKVHTLADEHPLLHVEVLDRTGTGERIVVAVHSSEERELVKLLAESGFTHQDFGARTGSATALIEETERELSQVRSRMEGLHEKALSLAEELPRFRLLRDGAGMILERMNAARAARQSSHVSLFRGYVRTRELKSLRSCLSDAGEVSIEVIEPDEGEVLPSPLTENKAAAPYSLLVDMYGKPTRKDPDPTPLIAPFYALFFGICVGDAGYGLALAAGSAAGWAIVRRRHGNPRLFQLLFQGGLASILIGIFLGGWFGMSFDSLPSFLQAPANLLNGLIPGYVPGEVGQEGFSVSKQFLYLTLALGLLQLIAGIVVNLVKRLRAGEGYTAAVDQAGWLLATIGLFPWLFNHYLLNGALYDVSGPLDKVFTGMLAAGAVLIFIMGGREAKGFGKIGLGAYATYGIVNLLGDVLSYSRLFALALSSAIIAQVINEMAGMVRSELGIPVIGILLAALVVIGGHIFNLGMACLSGFIHTARLQFVEFFGKFYDGTGVPFKPLRYESKFVHIERDE